MTVDIGDALATGVERTIARSGLILVGAFFVLNVLNGLLGLGVRAVAPRTPGAVPGQVDLPPSPELGAAAGVLGLVFALVSLVLYLAAMRTFVSDETERVPAAFFTRNLLWAGINLVVGWIVFAVVVGVGLLLFVLPGLYLLVALAFWPVFVAVEDESFVAAFRSSWGLTRGTRLRLFLLGLVVVVVTIVVNAVFGVPGAFLGVVGVFLSAIGGALSTVFSTATLAAAFVQLRADAGVEPEAAVEV